MGLRAKVFPFAKTSPSNTIVRGLFDMFPCPLVKIFPRGELMIIIGMDEMVGPW